MTSAAPAQRASLVHRALRNPLTVIGATLACFLVVLVLLTARVVSGQEQALQFGKPSSAQVVRHGNVTLRTTVSGRVLGPVTSPEVGQSGTATPAALVTRTSGGAAGEGGQDD